MLTHTISLSEKNKWNQIHNILEYQRMFWFQSRILSKSIQKNPNKQANKPHIDAWNVILLRLTCNKVKQRHLKNWIPKLYYRNIFVDQTEVLESLWIRKWYDIVKTTRRLMLINKKSKSRSENKFSTEIKPRTVSYHLSCSGIVFQYCYPVHTLGTFIVQTYLFSLWTPKVNWSEVNAFQYISTRHS